MDQNQFLKSVNRYMAAIREDVYLLKGFIFPIEFSPK